MNINENFACYDDGFNCLNTLNIKNNDQLDLILRIKNEIYFFQIHTSLIDSSLSLIFFSDYISYLITIFYLYPNYGHLYINF
jgi:hypothetical protein